MQTAFSFAAALTLLAAPAFAADRAVPQSTLAAVGLADMQVLTDVDGQEVRGMSGNAMAMGLSLVSGLIVDPTTKSFVFGADVNAAMSSAENAGLQVLTNAHSAQASAIALNLTILPSAIHPGFSGTIIGGAGGTAWASSN